MPIYHANRLILCPIVLMDCILVYDLEIQSHFAYHKNDRICRCKYLKSLSRRKAGYPTLPDRWVLVKAPSACGSPEVFLLDGSAFLSLFTSTKSKRKPHRCFATTCGQKLCLPPWCSSQALPLARVGWGLFFWSEP